MRQRPCYNHPVTITLSEAESRRLMANHGVPVSPFVTGPTTDEVMAAAAAHPDLRFPLVAKLCGRAIAHKTERGLVRLNLNDDTALKAACEDLLAQRQPDDGDVELLVSSMIVGNRELIAGLTTDPQFGMTIMIGLGGVLAEAIGDVSFRLAPITPADADEMIDDLTSQRLLAPFRGEPAVDRSALAAMLVALSHLPEADPTLCSADLNPLIIADGIPIAVDALVEVSDPLEPDDA